MNKLLEHIEGISSGSELISRENLFRVVMIQAAINTLKRVYEIKYGTGQLRAMIQPY